MKKKRIHAKGWAALLFLAAGLPLLMTACSPTDNPASPFAQFIEPIGTPTCTQPEGWDGIDISDGTRALPAGSMAFTRIELDVWANVYSVMAQVCAGSFREGALSPSALPPAEGVWVVLGLYTDNGGKPYQLIVKSDPIDHSGYCGEGFNLYYGEKGVEIYVQPGTYWLAIGNQQGQAEVAIYGEGGETSWTSDCLFPGVLTSNCLEAGAPAMMGAAWYCYGGGQPG